MTDLVHWNVAVDTVTDALIRSHLALQQPPTGLDAFVEQAVNRELDRLALLEHERAVQVRNTTDDMWVISVPLPR